MTQKSKRELERQLEGIEKATINEIPEIGLIDIFAAVENGRSIELIDADQRVYQIGNETVRIPLSILEALSGDST